MDVRSSNAISYLAELLKRMVYLKITRKLKIHKMQLQQMTDIWTAIRKNFRLRLKFLSPRAKYTNRTGLRPKIDPQAQETPSIHGHGCHHPSPFPLSPPGRRIPQPAIGSDHKISNVSILPLGPCVIEYQLCQSENDQDGRAEAFEMTKTPLYIVVHGGIETEQKKRTTGKAR
jgi:hypothetical protein